MVSASMLAARSELGFFARLLGHFDHGFQLNQDTFFRLDLGRRLRHPGASLLHIRLQFLAGGSAIAPRIFCTFQLPALPPL